MKRFLVRHAETVIMPVFLLAVYTAFVLTSNAKGAALVLSLSFLVFVLFLWFGFRRLKLHAQASRLAGVGDPDGLLALIERELPRCWTENGRRPLHVHAAIAHNLRGDWAAARAALDRSGFLKHRGRSGRGWIPLAAAADVTTRTEQGDLAGAKVSYARLAPMAAIAPYGGMELVARECEARLLLAEGDPAAARERIAPLVKNIRLSDATRAQLHALLARSATALGEADVAAEHAAKARELAPRLALLP
jgi:hypothetical protein